LNNNQVTILNDAAWVGYELANGLREVNMNVKYLPRNYAGPNVNTNALYSVYGKIINPFVNAIKAKGIIHVNYALQDAFFVRLIKKEINVLHCHGTDLFGLYDEEFKKNSKDLTRWSKIIEGNLKYANSVIVSTPEMLKLAKIVRPDAEYLPNPIDTTRFCPKVKQNSQLKAIGFNSWYERVPKYLIELMEKNGIKVDIHDRRPFSYLELHKNLKEYDIYIDRIFTKGVSSHSKTCLEAMACGLVTIDYRHKDHVNERVIELLDEDERRKESKNNRQFIIDNHDRKKVIKKLLNIYRKQVE